MCEILKKRAFPSFVTLVLAVLVVGVICSIPVFEHMTATKAQKPAEAPVQQVAKNDLASQFAEVKELTERLAIHCPYGTTCGISSLPTLRILGSDQEMVDQFHALKTNEVTVILGPEELWCSEESGTTAEKMIILSAGCSREEYRQFLLGKP